MFTHSHSLAGLRRLPEAASEWRAAYARYYAAAMFSRLSHR